MGRKVLIIDDNSVVNHAIQTFLLNDGFEVTSALLAKEGLHLVNTQIFDLILLDLLLPDQNGEHVLKEIRRKSQVPIIIISSLDDVNGKATQLRLGADDYITKPISMIELSARIESVLRRTKMVVEAEEESYTFLNLKLDVRSQSVYKNNQRVLLTGKEFDILKLLLKNMDKVISKQQLYESVWKQHYLDDENILNVHIKRLRNKIEDSTNEPKYIQTVWGRGYIMTLKNIISRK